MLMTPLCNRLSLRQATRRVTLLCDQALAPLDLRATQLSMRREIDRLGPGAGSSGAQNLWRTGLPAAAFLLARNRGGRLLH
jgi:hypothetical protein